METQIPEAPTWSSRTSIMNEMSSGVPGMGELRPGAHVCALYTRSAERDRLLVPFMQEGLRRGEECVCLMGDLGDVEAATMQRRAYGRGRPGDSLTSGHLRVYSPSGPCARAAEASVEQAITSLPAAVAWSAEGGLPLLRAAAEMSWSQQPGVKELAAYESAVSQVLAEMPALFLCMYDLQQLEVRMLVEVLRMHSTVVLDGTVLHNPHCLVPHCSAPPTDPEPRQDTGTRYPLARRHSGRLDGGDRWLSLTGAEVRITDLVASGRTNRAIAEELVVSRHTVDAHLKHIYVKLGIHSRVELTVLALQHGTRPVA